MPHSLVRALVLLAVLPPGPLARAATTFEFLKLANGDPADLPGGSLYAEAYGVSADGRFVVGNSSSTSSGLINPVLGGSATEGFVWDGSSQTIVGVGDIDGGRFSSQAFAVSANGQFVVGGSEGLNGTRVRDPIRWMPFLWTRGNSPAIVPLSTNSFLYREPAAGAFAACTSISDDGATIVGTVSWQDETTFQGFERSFYLTQHVLTFTFLDLLPAQSGPVSLSPDGHTIVGAFSANGGPTNAFRQQVAGGITVGTKEDLGQVGNVTTYAFDVASGGKKIVGQFFPSPGPSATYLYTDGAQPPVTELGATGNRPAGISGDGRVVVDVSGGLYLDGHGPFDLRQVLADAGAIDLRSLAPGLFRVRAISTNGLVIVGGAFVNGFTQAWRVRFADCDGTGVPDELEQLVYAGDVASLISEGSQRFAASRETLGYGDMISQYGRPWKPGKGRVPERDETQPAEFLRAALVMNGCGGTVKTVSAAQQFLAAVGFPSVNELHTFEMLLGNEAYSDALDPTIGLDGIPADDLSDQFAFKGQAGIQDLLDEELALLRGRSLPGAPADWLNETIYYPELVGPGDTRRRVAVYNRLPPNATAASGTAYRSSYRVADNFEAAGKFPQGHGDAYGHFLTAFKAGLNFLKSGPTGWPEEFLGEITSVMAGSDAGLETVRHLAEAGVGRAQSAAQLAELLYRRDYVENPKDPRAAELFHDRNPDQAWSMGEWAQRGALGAFFDWALVCHLAPTDESKAVHREGLPELDELAGSVSALQERVDTAGAGLDPLGLVQNVVPFGIDASGLQPGSGHSHFEQVRDAAQRALDNARKAFEVANQAGQRLRDSDQSLEDFSNKLDDTIVDFDQQLIEIFGLPSPDDPQDNDLDPTTNDFTESQSHPDLTRFFATDEDLAAAGFAPRQAPGEVQIALSELRVAQLRVEQAGLAIEDISAQIQSKLERIELLTSVQADRIDVISTSCSLQENLTKRLQAIEQAKGMFSTFTSGMVALATGNPASIQAFAVGLAGMGIDSLGGKDDIEIERQRVQCDKELKLQGLEDLVVIDAEQRELQALLRRPAQLAIDLSVAVEVGVQSLGRLRKAAARGELILKNKQRLVARSQGNLLEQRWKDLGFRVFRNAALKNFRALFDLAARYVVLAARAYAYEFDARSDGEDVLAGIYRERRLGGATGLGGGLQGVLDRINASVTVNNFNRPLETLGERSFSFRRNLLGIGAEDFPNDDLNFRAFLETQIVERIEDLSEITELAQISVTRDYGPGIVIPFSTEIDGRNFFGRGPELPFGNSNFSLTRNAKIRSYAIRLDGVDASLGTDPESGTVFVYLLPAGDSVLRENTNKPLIEDELITPWAVVDQFLPTPPLASISDFSKRSYNPWRSTAQVSGNFLNEIKRQRDSEAQIELGQSEAKTRYNTNLAGRSAWNTRWLLVIPGSQWTSSSDPAEIRRKVLQFVYGTKADPAQHVGITDIRLIIQAYSH